jgi:succinate dehydrogenase/fumarate reductase cytochrome b subunit
LKYLIPFFFLVVFTFADAQQIELSDKAEVSILTMGPGQQLYDSFGHSAFRVKDELNSIDLVYNYGVYDFNTPNFYLKFARGKLMYKLAVSSFLPFQNYYIRQNRWIEEQVLNLNQEEKQVMFEFLQNNAKPENSEYLYDFFYDNCATRIRDVLVSVLGDDLVYKEGHITKNLTFRELIQKNVHWNSWGSLGMDTAIGAVVDKEAAKWDYQFLPEYVMKGSANAKIKRGPTSVKLVKTTNSLFKNNPVKRGISFFTSPLFVFGILGLIILFVTYNDSKKNKRSRYLDALLFFTTGLIGTFILLLWFATDHSSTLNNYNILWTFPLSLLFSLAISKKNPKKWIGKYVLFLIIMLILLVLHWFTGVQSYAKALIPLFIALGIRYIYVYRFLKRQ